MRIAVHPLCQQKGMGSSLLADVKQYAVDNGFDVLGTSFGANVELLSFWFKANFSLCRLGFSCDKASGEHSALLLQSLTEKGADLTSMVSIEFYRSFSYLLTQQYQMLSADVVNEILKQRPSELDIELTYFDEQTVEDFSEKVRLYDSCVYSLQLWLIKRLSQSVGKTKSKPIDIKAKEVLISRILQKIPISQLCYYYGFSGKKALNDYVVETVKQLKQ
jgi:tRNA(Met) cytidine acetyltransferase